jgi:hypothetical protein
MIFMGGDGVLPQWEKLVPHCWDTCPSHDGKRCQVTGVRPGPLCEPTVERLAQRAYAAFQSE